MGLTVLILTKGEASVPLASLGHTRLLNLFLKYFQTRRHVWNVEFEHFLNNMIISRINQAADTILFE